MWFFNNMTITVQGAGLNGRARQQQSGPSVRLRAELHQHLITARCCDPPLSILPGGRDANVTHSWLIKIQMKQCVFAKKWQRKKNEQRLSFLNRAIVLSWCYTDLFLHIFKEIVLKLKWKKKNQRSIIQIQFISFFIFFLFFKSNETKNQP